jgi:hypothetical protein
MDLAQVGVFWIVSATIFSIPVAGAVGRARGWGAAGVSAAAKAMVFAVFLGFCLYGMSIAGQRTAAELLFVLAFGALVGFAFLFFAPEDVVLSTVVVGVMCAVLFSGVLMGWLSVGRLLSWQLIP